MKAVVTGAAGFIGSHLALSLHADGHEVIGIDCFSDYYPRPLKEFAPLRDHARFRLVEERLQDAPLARHPTVSLRFFTVYGPRQRPDMACHRFLKAARDAPPITVYGDGSQTRDFTYVGDIVSAARAAALSGRPGSVYNVGGGERVALNEVLRLIEGVTGPHLQIERQEPQMGDMKETCADTSAASRELGLRSTVALVEGLAREWQWIRELA